MVKALIWRQMRALLRYKKADGGTTAVEFALIAAPFFYFLMLLFETGFMLFSEYVIEHGVSEAARMIRTGTVQNCGVTKAKFKDLVCGKLEKFLRCQDRLYVDVRNFTTFQNINLPQPIVDNKLSTAVKDGAQFNPGGPMTVAVVRTYYEWKLFVPGMSQLANLEGGNRLLTAGAAFRNEPYPPGQRPAQCP
jgi:Flp pilus assembly protein TadG